MCIRDRCYVNGEWVGTPVDPVVNPATGQTIGHVPRFGATEAAEAVEHAGKALKTVSYTHLRAHETVLDLVCRLLLDKKKNNNTHTHTHYTHTTHDG